jgi:hypothetical protein
MLIPGDHIGSQDSSVGTATSCGLDSRGDGVRVTIGTRIIFPPHVLQAGSGTHPTSYPMGNGDLFHKE